jgi:hypothetical protein
MESIELTKEEESEFTIFNAGAYDLYRKEQAENGVEAPCWLCISKESKNELRKQFIVWARDNFSFGNTPEEEIIRQINKSTIGPLLFTWKRMELEAKAMRIKGNPSAYFHPIK